jgi:hypothetical protein
MSVRCYGQSWYNIEYILMSVHQFVVIYDRVMDGAGWFNSHKGWTKLPVNDMRRTTKLMDQIKNLGGNLTLEISMNIDIEIDSMLINIFIWLCR